MAFDVVVFSQDELLDALNAGFKSIALCDNHFSLPDTEGINYTIIGKVVIEGAEMPSGNAEKPKNDDIVPVYAHVENKPLAYSSSYGSYGSGSGSGGGSYAYEYEYGGSFKSSFQTSFVSSYYSFIGGSFAFGGSYVGSFAYGGSYSGSFVFGGSYGGSFSGSAGFLPDIIEYGSSGIIFVNGYGINLI